MLITFATQRTIFYAGNLGDRVTLCFGLAAFSSAACCTSEVSASIGLCFAQPTGVCAFLALLQSIEAKAHLWKSLAEAWKGSISPVSLHGMISVDSDILYVAGHGGSTAGVAPQQWPHHWHVPGGGGGGRRLCYGSAASSKYGAVVAPTQQSEASAQASAQAAAPSARCATILVMLCCWLLVVGNVRGAESDWRAPSHSGMSWVGVCVCSIACACVRLRACVRVCVSRAGAILPKHCPVFFFLG